MAVRVGLGIELIDPAMAVSFSIPIPMPIPTPSSTPTPRLSLLRERACRGIGRSGHLELPCMLRLGLA
jgi:hypothetical protein